MNDKIFIGFQPVTKEAWHEQVVKDLKGKDYTVTLISETDGINIEPLYAKQDVPQMVSDIESGSGDESYETHADLYEYQGQKIVAWEPCGEINLKAELSLNDCIVEQLQKGISYLRISGDLDYFFKQINYISYAATFSLHIESDLTEDDIATTYREQLGAMGKRDLFVQCIELDPISHFIKTGKIHNEEKTFTNLAAMYLRINAHMPDCKLIKVDGSVFSNASYTEQLAYTLAIASDYIDKLCGKNILIEELIHLITFRFSVSENYFSEISKLRAFKIVWINLIKAFIPDYDFIPNPYIHVVASNTYASQTDKHTLVIKQTLQAMSAILGECDVLSIEPLNEGAPLETNIHMLLRHEAYMDDYREVAAGSFYIETLTTQLAENAWQLFKQIEDDGGFLTCWKNGLIKI